MWESGHLRVRSESRREQLLPIPVDVGAAIAAYVQHAERQRAADQLNCS